MIAVKLQGGIGNQLFQYSIGRSLSTLTGMQLVFETSYFDTSGAWTFGLDAFNVQPYRTVSANPQRWKYLFGTAGLPIGGVLYVKERAGRFDSSIRTIKKSVFLDGYWQSEDYFADIKAELAKELTLRNGLAPETAVFLNDIYGSESVSLHVRRGDYVSNPAANSVHGVLNAEYYQTALKHFENKFGSTLKVFVFSDDIEWCRRYLNLPPQTVFVKHIAIDALNEQQLMASCRHQIIANSTFSWWAAWLNANPGKTVIAPKKWFAAAGTKSEKIVPPSWLRM